MAVPSAASSWRDRVRATLMCLRRLADAGTDR
ncbi:MAG: hypothetical protein QOC63_5949, partial [Mycobacterium sp.]|nr:hypothetical protein [Mycobacterium sp.]